MVGTTTQNNLCFVSSQLTEDKLRFYTVLIHPPSLIYKKKNLSHKKVQTWSSCLWSLTFVNLLSALKELSMEIMRHCLRLWVFNGNKPATVCACFVLPGEFFKARVFLSPFFSWMGGCRLQTTWETACQRLGRECYSGRRGSNPICLRWSLQRGGSRLGTQLCSNKHSVHMHFDERSIIQSLHNLCIFDLLHTYTNCDLIVFLIFFLPFKCCSKNLPSL